MNITEIKLDKEVTCVPWTLLSKHQHYRGIWEQCWHCRFCVLSLKAAILSHMTSKLFAQTKDDEMHKCIKF